jgi:hypothetical protein
LELRHPAPVERVRRVEAVAGIPLNDDLSRIVVVGGRLGSRRGLDSCPVQEVLVTGHYALKDDWLVLDVAGDPAASRSATLDGSRPVMRLAPAMYSPSHMILNLKLL